jgi:group II intron reverse transcriptase/maturase
MAPTSRTETNVLSRASSTKVLWRAWAHVAGGSPMPGVDGVSVPTFARRLSEHLDEVGRLLRRAEYQAMPLKQITVGDAGDERVFGIPTVRDRVAERAFLTVLRGTLDAQTAETSFAYRRGRSWLDALAAAERCRDEGLRWVFRGDIEAFFDSIDHELLGAALQRVVRDRAAVEVLLGWCAAPYLTDNGLIDRPRGVPQGAPIAPALANYYLAPLDAAVDGGHGRLVRYADHFAVFCHDHPAAQAASTQAHASLTELRLRLNAANSYTSSFDRGFGFLGWVFFRDGGYEEDPTDQWTHPMSVARPRGGV